MLRRTRSSRARFADYRRKLLDPQWAKMEVGPGGSERKPKHEIARPVLELLRHTWSFIGADRLTLVLALCTLTLSTLLGLAIPSATKLAIDYVILDHPGPSGLPAWLGLPTERMTLLWMISAAMMVLAVLAVATGMWGRWQTTRMTKLLQASLRRKAFDHAMRLPLYRVQALKSGGVTSLLREDAGAAGDLIFSVIYNPWRAIIQLAGTLIVLSFVDWRLLLGGLLIVPAVWITHRQWINRIRPLFRDLKVTRSATDGHTTEAFAGVRVVRGFSRAKAELGRFTVANHLMGRQEVLIWWRSRVLETLWSLLIPAASVGVLIYGGSRVIEGDLTIGDVMMFTTYVLMLLGPLETLTSTASTVQTNLAALDRILDLLDEPLEFAPKAGEAPRELVRVFRASARGEIVLDDVWFEYPTGRKGSPKAPKVPGADSPGAVEPAWVLRGIDLSVPPGRTVALVGASGAGKTTLSNLVARFYDPSRGRVLFDGVDLREIDPASYRGLLGIVEQDVFLFDGTVAENIAYGRRSATIEEVKRAAGLANAAGFIEAMERGYETVIGERGVRLSGGQRQRIAIARAILADPVVLILDEATSNLDSESEALIQRSLGGLMKGRTCFVIAHRLSTIRNADVIVVLEKGEIVETGTHTTLIESGGRYSELLRTQLEAQGVGPEAVAPRGETGLAGARGTGT
ncbi:MAG: ABC transporter ATP-binding protein [Planctomycetota bacterium]